jgi:hypothetical protein
MQRYVCGIDVGPGYLSRNKRNFTERFFVNKHTIEADSAKEAKEIYSKRYNTKPSYVSAHMIRKPHSKR